MTGAEFKTLRESLNLPVSWVARQGGVRERTVSYWEASGAPVPQDMERLLLDVEQKLNQLATADAEGIPLLRYRTDADLWKHKPEMRPLPATAYAAMLGWRRRHLLAAGRPAPIDWFQP
ncbi:MAG: hypothetical protein BGO63_11290 [Candidatus Accumulibacter sp. 66-26]|nr:MAG: hypothetical protein BGO63_11290 [Candidatus Accumulibacter sp. 66-26]